MIVCHPLPLPLRPPLPLPLPLPLLSIPLDLCSFPLPLSSLFPLSLLPLLSSPLPRLPLRLLLSSDGGAYGDRGAGVSHGGSSADGGVVSMLLKEK